ncbi:MAG: hypothetical protein P4L55_23250 [Syntrophobacteraceae bacterium]|nr:hypothetical protein [Syntrophobacteraceae bacterium]
MNETNMKRAGWESTVIREMTEFYFYALYLAFFFISFTWYRRLILTEYQVSYLHYGVGIIEALVLAKVIMVGRALHLGERFKGYPLILPIFYKAVVFSVFVGIFGVVESTINGLLHGKGIAAGFNGLIGKGGDELLARCLVTFVAFIPFFTFDELELLGEGKIIKLLFQRRPAAESAPTKDETP